jgi:hypothetical protein
MQNKTKITLSLALAILIACAGRVAMAAPTPSPVPGGANEVNGVSGTFSQVLFNGELRLKNMSLVNPTPAERASPAFGRGNIVFHAIVSNGEKKSNFGYFHATLSDADGITVTGSPLDDGWDLIPGASARAAYVFTIPAGYVPTKLVLIQAARSNPKAFRITIRPSDLPSAAPAASP